jgi:hypothetical protein
MANFYQGHYKVINKEKYIGKKDPIYRSSWESRVMFFMDNSLTVKKWGSEIIAIPYLNRLDGKMHRYFPDFYCEIIDNSGLVKKCIVEVKPQKQSVPPQKPKNNNRKAQVRYLNEVSTYIINQCKWDACKDMCNKNGMEFIVLNEQQIF